MRRSGAIRVLVVGAGVGGLAVAGALDRAGADVVVVERTNRFGDIGSGLSLFGNGFRALDALGLGDRMRAVCADRPPVGESGLRRLDGTWLMRTSPAATAELRAVSRTELHAALLAGAGDAELRMGVEILAADDNGIDLADGGRLDGFDLVIGADGLRSRVRAGWSNDPGIAYAGYGAWRGITGAPVGLDFGGETLGRGHRFGMVPLRDGRVYWFAAVSAPRSATPGIDDLRRYFAGWHEPIAELIDATDPDAISYLPIEYLARPPECYVTGRRVLIGDAAHAMPPDMGQGANQAFEDAAVLVNELAPVLAAGDRMGIAAALRSYDRSRRPRSRRIARQARMLGRIMQAGGPVATVRDAALRLAPDAIVSSASIRLQNWQPDR